MNARIHYVKNNETDILGNHIIGRGRDYLEEMSILTKQNREMFTGFCQANEYRIRNTDFNKTPNKLATFREFTTDHGPPWNATRYMTLDYIMVKNQYKNSVTDVTARTDIHFDSDHYILEANINVKLKGNKK